MTVELVVLDFDGTLTDVDKEAVDYVRLVQEAVGKDAGLSQSEIVERWKHASREVESNPTQHGWLMGGKIVAPAYADPLIMSRTVANLVFDSAGVLMDDEERSATLEGYFHNNYSSLGTVFKPGADEALHKIKDAFDTVVVTNSKTDKVEHKLSVLGDHGDVPVHGDAKKYRLVDDWDAVPVSVEPAGFGRELFLRRKMYGDVLEGLMEERGIGPEQVAVVGDIYELDLLLPEHMGMHTVLTPRPSTPAFEVAAVAESPRGYVSFGLDRVVTFLHDLGVQ
jgi:FMN phosphatase YigB (HAD superfamily)